MMQTLSIGLSTRDIRKDRSSIYLAAKKIELYLFQSEEAKRSYKLYFDLEGRR